MFFNRWLPLQQAIKDNGFFSLRWKVLSVLALVILAIFFILYTLTTASYQESFETSNQQRRELHSRLFEDLLHSKKQSLLATQEIAQGLLSNSAEPVNFSNIWAVIKSYKDIEGLTIYDSQRNIVGQYSNLSAMPFVKPPDNKHFEYVAEYGVADSFYQCDPSCSLLTLGLYEVGAKRFYLLIHSGLVGLTRKFNVLSYSRLVILTRDKAAGHAYFWIENMNRHIEIAEKPLQVRKTLLQLQHYEIGTPVILQHEGIVWDLHSIPTETPAFEALIMSNVTIGHQQLQSYNFRLAMVSLGVSLLFLSALSLLAQAPLKRLRALTQALPKLASGNFKQLREAVERSAVEWRPDELSQVNRSVIEISYQLEAMEKERRTNFNQLEYTSSHDALTRLLTRRVFEEAGNKLIRNHTPFYLLFIDLNEFKHINDQFGHSAGDLFLIQVANELRQSLPGNDMIYRLGGDEFAFIEHQNDFQQISRSVNQASKRIRQKHPGFQYEKMTSCMATGATHFPTDANNLHDLLNCADRAMYRAKYQGISKVCLYYTEFERELYTQADKRSFVLEIIRQDLIEIYWQPIVDMQQGGIFAYECLSRLKMNDLQKIQPSITQFIHHAEQGGIMPELDLYIARKILKKLSAQHPAAPCAICINLSATTMNNRPFTLQLLKLVEKLGNLRHRLIFEITETAEIGDIPVTVQFMERLRGMGVRFSLDDFGDGFASFSHLRNLPFDLVKIDGGFIKNLATSEKDNILVDTMIHTAREFNLQVVAEYVENTTILNILREKGIEFGQGYYFGSPEPGFNNHQCL